MKKKWNTPNLLKLNISKTADPGKSDAKWEGHVGGKVWTNARLLTS